MNSLRFYWCSGCGRWHDPLKGQAFHYLMACSLEEPNEQNFEGSPEELERFKMARAIRAKDAAAFEKRIDDALATNHPQR